MQSKTNKKVIVVGSGLGGISTALSLALEGFDVTIHEKNEKIGGKLNTFSEAGYTYDLGPSILTLPYIFSRPFEKAGRKIEDYVNMVRVRPHWRNIFEDGVVIDLYPERDKMHKEAAKVGEPSENVDKFLKYSEDLFDLINDGYFEKGIDNAAGFRKHYGLKKFFDFDLFNNMHGSVASRFKTSYFVSIFDFFIKYVGSSAFKAPAFMNCMSTIQFRYDLWYVMGGMYNLAQGLEELMRELGIEIRLNSEISEILKDKNTGKVEGVKLVNDEIETADAVVSNMEVIPTYKRLLHEPDHFVNKLEKKYEPACSGLVIDIGLDRKYESLSHHNFLFSNNPKKHFNEVFQKKNLPGDPTLYVVAASRTDSSIAPQGCDTIKILPHIPYIDPDNPLSEDDYMNLKERVLDKMERMACPNLRDHIVHEHILTPHDISINYYSNRGSIYGVVSDRFKNFAFKAPKKSERYDNLYFAGGSVNPGGGMPMVFLCGQKVAENVVSDLTA